MNKLQLQKALETICKCQGDEPDAMPCTVVIGRNGGEDFAGGLTLVSASGSIIRELIDGGYSLVLDSDGLQVGCF